MRESWFPRPEFAGATSTRRRIWTCNSFSPIASKWSVPLASGSSTLDLDHWKSGVIAHILEILSVFFVDLLNWMQQISEAVSKRPWLSHGIRKARAPATLFLHPPRHMNWLGAFPLVEGDGVRSTLFTREHQKSPTNHQKSMCVERKNEKNKRL